MRAVAVYRCPKCGTEYRPLDAGDRRFFCCGVVLGRVERGMRMPSMTRKPNAPGSSAALSSPTRQASTERIEVIEIIPPRDNTVDALGIELLLSRFAPETTVSLEIAGGSGVRRFIFRAPHETQVHLRRQIQASYPQAEFRTVPPEQDPAHD